MYKGYKDEKDVENIINLILIPPEELVPANIFVQDSLNSLGLRKKKKFNLRQKKD